MITKLFLSNFKGFNSDLRVIPFRPITMIFGANSSGKSSILHAILLLNQSITEVRDPTTILLPNGSSVNLGGYREFVHKHDTKRDIRLGVEILEGDKILYTFNFKDNKILVSQFEGNSNKWTRRFYSKKTRVKTLPFIEFIGKSQKEDYYLIDFKNQHKLLNVLISNEKDRLHFRNHLKIIQLAFEKSLSERIKPDARDFAKIFYGIEIEARKFDLAYDFIDIFQRLKNTMRLVSGGDYTLSQLNSFIKDIIASWEKIWSMTKIEFQEEIEISSPIQGTISKGHYPPIKPVSKNLYENWLSIIIKDYFQFENLGRMYRNCVGYINSELTKIFYLSSSRELPQRFYLSSGNIHSNVGTSGSYTSELLFHSDEIKSEINKLFDRLKLNYKIDIHLSKEYPELFRIQLWDKGLRIPVNLSDVGYGYTQMLPILVQSYLSPENIIIVEQPEIHIHPRLQPELAQFFYQRIKENKRLQFIVETHSEHMLLRIQKLIREDKLSTDEVSILYVERTKTGSEVYSLEMDERGYFKDGWPQGFLNDSFDDILG